MMRWAVLTLLVVAASAAVPLIIMNLPESTPDRAVRHAAPIKKGPTGRVAVEGEAKHEFGTMAFHTKGEKDFVLKNVGEAPLELYQGATSCQCTVANFKNEEETIALKPGEETTLKVTWNPKQPGKFTQTVSVKTNDPTRPEVKFTVEGTVEPALVTFPNPASLDFGSIPNSEPHLARIAVSSPTKADLKIVSIKSDRPELFKATFEPLTPEERTFLKFDSGYQIKVELQPTKTLGIFQGEVVVETDHPLEKELRIPVGGKLIGSITALPESVRLGNVRGVEGGTGSILLSVRRDEPTQFEVESAPENLKVEVSPVDVKPGADGNARQYRMTVSVPRGTAPGVIDGMIVLKTDHPQADHLKIPTHVTVRGD